MHALIARVGDGFKHALWVREQPDGEWAHVETANRAEPAVTRALEFFAPAADFTCSTREYGAVVADMIEEPSQLVGGAAGCAITAFCREGRLETQDDRWARVLRFHDRREIFSYGLDSTFRLQT